MYFQPFKGFKYHKFYPGPCPLFTTFHTFAFSPPECAPRPLRQHAFAKVLPFGLHSVHQSARRELISSKFWTPCSDIGGYLWSTPSLPASSVPAVVTFSSSASSTPDAEFLSTSFSLGNVSRSCSDAVSIDVTIEKNMERPRRMNKPRSTSMQMAYAPFGASPVGDLQVEKLKSVRATIVMPTVRNIVVFKAVVIKHRNHGVPRRLKAGLHVRRKHKRKHTARDDESTRKWNARMCLCRTGSHVA